MKKIIIINGIVITLLFVVVMRTSSLTGWIDKIFASKYEKAESAYGGPTPENEQGKLKAKLVEFDEKYRTDTKIIIQVIETDDKMLFKEGEEIYIEGQIKYFDENTKEYIYTGDKVPDELRLKEGDIIYVKYYWEGMEFKYSNCFFTVLKEKDGYKYMPSGAFIYKVINLPE